MLFLLPFLAEVADFSLICWVIIALAFIASVEEFFIVIRCKHLNRDTKSIFSAIK